jgi:hypothetical protein
MESIWYDLDSKCERFGFEVIYAVENSNKFQKTRFWNEKSVEDMVTLGPTAHATLVYIIPRKMMIP